MTSSSIEAGSIYTLDFENNSLSWLPKTSLCCSHSAQIVSWPVSTGKYAVKFVLNSYDKGYIYNVWRDPVVKAELQLNNVARVGDRRWYGFSVYIAPSWNYDYDDNNGTLVAQWHTNIDSGEIAKGPHLTLMVKHNAWVVANASDPTSVTRSLQTVWKKAWGAGYVEKGKWTDWVVYAKWSYLSDGELRVWKNGSPVVNWRGPNTYNDQQPEFFKFGIYKPWWNREEPSSPTTLIVYYDEVRIHDSSSSYAEVAPR